MSCKEMKDKDEVRTFDVPEKEYIDLTACICVCKKCILGRCLDIKEIIGRPPTTREFNSWEISGFEKRKRGDLILRKDMIGTYNWTHEGGLQVMTESLVDNDDLVGILLNNRNNIKDTVMTYYKCAKCKIYCNDPYYVSEKIPSSLFKCKKCAYDEYINGTK
jgi:hypothetical protein